MNIGAGGWADKIRQMPVVCFNVNVNVFVFPHVNVSEAFTTKNGLKFFCL